MKSVSGKEFSKVLERNGWVLLRIQSIHHIYGKQGSNVRLFNPIHGNQTMKMGLLKQMMKLANLSEDDL